MTLNKITKFIRIFLTILNLFQRVFKARMIFYFLFPKDASQVHHISYDEVDSFK